MADDSMGQKLATPDYAERQQQLVARIERLPFRRWHIKTRLIVGTATFFDAVDVLMIAYILPVLIPLWHIRPTQIGLLISSGYVGQLAGSLFFGWYAEKRGRISSLSATVTVFSTAAFFCSLSWSYWALFMFRFIQGFGLGGEVPVAATYINELAKAEGRGKFVLLYEMIFSVGLVLAALLGFWIVPRFGWRVMFLVGAVIGMIVPILRRRLPESPRWLANQLRFDEAEKVVTSIENAISENGRIPLPAIKRVPLAEIKPRRWREFFEGIYLRRTLTVWVIWFCAYFCGQGIAAWLPSLYTSVYKLPLQISLKYALIFSVVGLAGAFSIAVSIDRVGRKRAFAGAFVLMAVFLLAVFWLGRVSAMQLLLLTSIANYFNNIVCIVLWLYTPEIYPTRMRALGGGLGTAWYRVATAVAPILVGMILSRSSVPYVFAMFGSVALLGGIITAVFAVETRGRVLEEVSP